MKRKFIYSVEEKIDVIGILEITIRQLKRIRFVKKYVYYYNTSPRYINIKRQINIVNREVIGCKIF